MDKQLLKESIAHVKQGIATSKENIRKAQHQLAEGEEILKLFQKLNRSL